MSVTSGQRVFRASANQPDEGGRPNATQPGADLPPDVDLPRVFPYPVARAVLAKFYAFLAMLLGITVATGWLLSAEPLLRLIPDSILMNFNSALLMTLTGAAVCVGKHPLAAPVRRAVGGVIIMWSTLLILQSAGSLDIGLGWNGIHSRIITSNMKPNMVAPATCVAFFLIGYVLQRLDMAYTQRSSARLRRAIGTIALLCAVGFAGFFLDLNLLYPWYQFNRMALGTAVGLTLLTLSIFFIYQANDREKAQRPSRAGSRIVTIGTVLLLIMGVAAGLTGFVMFFNYQKAAAASQLQSAAVTRAMVVESTINEALNHARFAVGRGQVIDEVRRLSAAPDNVAIRAQATKAITNLLVEGFSSVAFLSVSGDVLAEAGYRVTKFDAAMPLKTDFQSRLLWSSGFVLETRSFIAEENGKVVGAVQTQRRFDALSSFFLDISIIGATADTALCGRTEAGVTGCFPTYQIRRPQEFIARDDRGRLAIDDALAGITAVRIAKDYRNEQVMAAYTPVGDYGLGMILKLDAMELFAPIRSLLERTLMTLLVLLLIGAYILRRLIRPLVWRIIDSERRARDANTLAVEREIRSRTVVDHVFDGILSMNANGIILSANPAACGMFGYSPEQMVGQHFAMLLPRRHRQAARAFFSEYQNPDFPASLKSHVLKLRGARQGGSEFHFELGTNEVTLSGQKGYVGILHDVTESFEARRALMKSEKMLRTITDNLPALVGYVDKNEHVVFANKAYEAWYGKPLSEIVQHSLSDLLGADYARTQCQVALALEGKPVRFEQMHGCLADGTATYSQTTYIPEYSNNGMVAGFYVLASDITESKGHEEALRHLAYHDTLTELPNRRLFHDRLDQAMTRSMRRHTMVALFYLDVDHFKGINDTLGHDNGDLLLQEFGRRLSEAVRASDTVARMGGDEFTVIMEDIALAADAEAVAVKILEAVRKPFILGNVCLQVTTSIGIALYSGESFSQDYVIKVSDDALYQSKQRGRNTHSLIYVNQARLSEDDSQMGLLDSLEQPGQGSAIRGTP